jgi:hypothetical protein
MVKIRDIVKPRDLPSSGTLSMSQIVGEFNKGNTFSAYYGSDAGVPTSPPMSVSDFYGKSDAFVPTVIWDGNDTFPPPSGLFTLVTKSVGEGSPGTQPKSQSVITTMYKQNYYMQQHTLGGANARVKGSGWNMECHINVNVLNLSDKLKGGKLEVGVQTGGSMEDSSSGYFNHCVGWLEILEVNGSWTPIPLNSRGTAMCPHWPSWSPVPPNTPATQQTIAVHGGVVKVRLRHSGKSYPETRWTGKYNSDTLTHWMKITHLSAVP